ncbi:MAG: PH domain-containing protein [Planctomycetota bacterium]
MFCKECGNQMTDESNFCPQCGAQLAGDAPVPQAEVDNTQPVLTLRPVFIPWVTVVSVLPLQIFFTVWGAGFFGGFGMFAVKGVGLPLPSWFTFVFFGLLFFFAIPILTYVARKRTYADTEYRFYPDRLEYAEGFWTAENKTINYRSINEASLRRGIIQRKYGLGTIYLATPATGMAQGRAMSGIRISDIPECEDVYTTVQQLINAQQ